MTLGRLGPVFSLARIPQPGAQHPAARSWLSATSAGLPGLILRGLRFRSTNPGTRTPASERRSHCVPGFFFLFPLSVPTPTQRSEGTAKWPEKSPSVCLALRKNRGWICSQEPSVSRSASATRCSAQILFGTLPRVLCSTGSRHCLAPNTLQGLPLCRGPGKDGGWFSVSRWLGALSWTWPEEKGWMLRATASLYAGQKQTSSAGSPVPIEKPSCGVAVAGRVGDWGSGAR